MARNESDLEGRALSRPKETRMGVGTDKAVPSNLNVWQPNSNTDEAVPSNSMRMRFARATQTAGSWLAGADRLS